jgi:hypothetical protein
VLCHLIPLDFIIRTIVGEDVRYPWLSNCNWPEDGY